VQINCFEPSIIEEDIEAVTNCLRRNELTFTKTVTEFEFKFSELSRKKFNIGFSSASAASYALFHFLYEQYGICDVYTSSLSFVSPAWAAKKNGHNVIFVDVDEQLLFDFENYKLQRDKYGSANINILMPVLYGGVSDIVSFSGVTDEIVIVDSAHCLTPNIKYDYAFFSFHPAKPIVMTNGGILATDDANAFEYNKKYRNFGRVPDSDSYTIEQEGFKFYMNGMNASWGLAQINNNRWQTNIARRKDNLNELRRIGTCGTWTKHDRMSSFHLGTLILNETNNKTVREFFKSRDIQVTYHYPLLHKVKNFGCDYILPRAEEFENKIVNLPIHQNLTTIQLEQIGNTIKELTNVKTKH